MDVQADLSAFGLGPMVRLVASLRELADGCASVEEFGQRVCVFLHECFLDSAGLPQTALVRFYATGRLGGLPNPEQAFVEQARPGLPSDTTCLALLGTSGSEPQWRHRTTSAGHRVLPLVDAEQVERMPMVAALLSQLGIDVHALIRARSDVVLPIADDLHRVFYVPEACGSPLIPAQDFVAEHGIASALGFGGALPTGEIYAVVVFSRVPVPLASARLFDTVALSTSLAAMEMLDLPLFEGQTSVRGGVEQLDPWARQEARVGLIRALLNAHEDAAIAAWDQAEAALEQARYDAARVREALAAEASHAVDRARLLELERSQSETLQRSFLSTPVCPPGTTVGVRYLPAAADAQVGGDWYDSFAIPGGATMLIIGDVVGHDVFAAAAMGQLRSLLRGVAYSQPGSPAALLRQFDDAISGLGLDVSATLIVARIDPVDDSGAQSLTWSSAGHPPPLLLTGDGVLVLETDADLMIGVDRGATRLDHARALTSGSTLLLYTDGLVERRGEDLEVGLSRLADALGQHAHLPLEELCDAVLLLASSPLEDDVALLALHLPAKR